jgi:hypothetical protein
MRTDHHPAEPMRPVRPFMVGMTAGALWAAAHVPQAMDAASGAELVAEAFAIAIVSGGVLALVTAIAGVGIRFGRARTRFGR